MKLQKILNNNVVVAINESNEEVILMGRGLAFQKKVGQEIDSQNVSKVYQLSNKDTSNKLQELIEDIPLDHLKITNDIIAQAKKVLSKELNETIYISLTDHINSSLIRMNEGIVVKNFLLWDIKRFFPEEYEIGLYAVDMIAIRLGITMTEDEAGFIALHIVNAQLGTKVENMEAVTVLMQEITTIVKYYYKLTFDESSVYFMRFINHLQFFAYRLVSDTTHQESEGDELLALIKLKYPNAYECVERITEFIQKKYDYQVSEEEQLYLTIHIVKIESKSIDTGN